MNFWRSITVKKIIIVNNIGDEFMFFSKMINENVDLLYIGNNDCMVEKHYKNLKDINLVDIVYFLRSNLKNGHYNFSDFAMLDKYNEIYTYGINESVFKDDLIKYLLKYKAKLILTSYKDLPQKIINLSKEEYCLKYNLMLHFNLKINDNFVEFYRSYSKKDLLIYYNKKYNSAISDYEKSSYIIDVEYAILYLLDKHKLYNVLLNDNVEVISSRVKKDKINILRSWSEQCDVAIVKNDLDVRCNKIIAINYFPGDQYKLLDKINIPAIMEKLYDADYKSSINYERMKVSVCLYEKK